MIKNRIYKNFSCVFTGDIEENAEKELLNKYKDTNILMATVIKVAHHGSKSSSKEEFIKKAEEMGYTQELIDEIVKDMEENIALGLHMDWKMCLVELPVSD